MRPGEWGRNSHPSLVDLEDERQVNKEEAEKLSEEWKIEYLETSARNNINVTEMFEKIARDVKRNKIIINPAESKTSTEKYLSEFLLWCQDWYRGYEWCR